MNLISKYECSGYIYREVFFLYGNGRNFLMRMMVLVIYLYFLRLYYRDWCFF